MVKYERFGEDGKCIVREKCEEKYPRDYKKCGEQEDVSQKLKKRICERRMQMLW